MAERSNGAETEGASHLDAAAKRLDRALGLLESRISALAGRAGGDAGGLFDFDRSKLAAELDQARAREHALEAASVEASQALAQAIDGVRRALARVGED